ncbi:substrate-binding domain-containing protein [Brevundimonas sp. 2R-24]|uniref:Substrate-binding domain-containing protein n=1 Tax=Peiella sedimenti TaxID=3061083 RepID=A0ABT8SM41_9CAUL|nr:substrate-binding domain-containing protein [Caulobacteraceae bacterium XZ-24]
MKKFFALAAAAALLAACGDGGAGGAGQSGARGVWAVGSSTVFPFTTRVAETFARKSGGQPGRVESLGTGGGFQAFCAGVGANTPDVANASRPMKASEFDLCQQNGVTDIVEIKVGYDGIVIADALGGAVYDFQLQDLVLALAAQTPSGSGFQPNPYTNWSQIRPGLADVRIQVYGPPPTSGTRDAFVELGLTPGARAIPAYAAVREQDEDRFEALAHTLREDGAWIDAGENDNAMVQTLTRTPGALGVFGYSFLENNRDQVQAARIAGIAPSVETIADGSYPLARSLYIYVKKAHVGVTPGLAEFVQEYMSDASAGRGGYLQERGLIPLPANELAAQRAIAQGLTPMQRPAS